MSRSHLGKRSHLKTIRSSKIIIYPDVTSMEIQFNFRVSIVRILLCMVWYSDSETIRKRSAYFASWYRLWKVTLMENSFAQWLILSEFHVDSREKIRITILLLRFSDIVHLYRGLSRFMCFWQVELILHDYMTHATVEELSFGNNKVRQAETFEH